nr:hypothetical protein [Moraxella sp. CTOTU46711]
MSDEDIQTLFKTLLSTRRIFHITTDATYSEKEIFKDSYFSGYGTGVLIKYSGTFFLLTAKHVLKDYIDGDLPNTSPFRIQSDVEKGFDNTNDFLYPKIIWDIGQLIKDNADYDFEDIILVELFPPLPNQQVKEFLLFEEIESLAIDKFTENKLSFESGYSSESNPFFHQPNNAEYPFDENKFTTSTLIKRDFIIGVLNSENSIYFFEKLNYLGKDTNGMSGGLIATIEDGKSKLIGIHIRGAKESSRINFIPIEKIMEAIVDYQNAPHCKVDYLYFDRLEKGYGFKPFHEFMDEEFADKFFRLGIPDNGQDDERVVKQYFDYLVKNKDFFLANYKDIDEHNGNTERTDNFEDILKMIDENK